MEKMEMMEMTEMMEKMEEMKRGLVEMEALLASPCKDEKKDKGGYECSAGAGGGVDDGVDHCGGDLGVMVTVMKIGDKDSDGNGVVGAGCC